MAPVAVEIVQADMSDPVPCSKKSSIQALSTRPNPASLDGNRKLPVTLLSGFLGSGKTTLLEHILTSNHGFRVGVIVNDMGALNIDAALLANHKVTRSEEKVVQMQNGCICCTLRGDLVEEVARLAEENAVDYLVIESSGISEPMQVAETFSEEFAEMHVAAGEDLKKEMEIEGESANTSAKVAEVLAAGGLPRISRLDTCVTVVDAVNFFNDFATADFLVDRHKKEDVPEEDDRNISDLQVDQLEFANVVIINKCDLVKEYEINRIKSVVKTLNPDAKIMNSVKSRVSIKEILDTHLFSYEKAAMGAGWLKSLQEEIKPETEEYGIGSFVYKARRPFHPARLWKAVKDVFVVIQEEFPADGEDGEAAEERKMDDEEEGEDGDDDDEDDEDDGEDADEEMEEEKQPQLNPKARLESKQANETFAPLLRSKGFFWLATRPMMFGEWSQAGVMLTLSGGDRWRCEVPEDEWPNDPRIRDMIHRDFEGEWGDRRQEIVFIGQQMRAGGEERLCKIFDACLLDDEEWKAWLKIMRGRSKDKKGKLEKIFEDGFEDWQEEDHTGHNH